MTKGQRIKELREAAGMTLEELAKQIGTTRQAIYKYEKDIVTNIPSDRIEALARVLHTTPEHILGWEKITEATHKKSDVAVNVTIRLGSDSDFREVVKRNYNDESFLALSLMLCRLDDHQLESVKNMLCAFYK